MEARLMKTSALNGEIDDDDDDAGMLNQKLLAVTWVDTIDILPSF